MLFSSVIITLYSEDGNFEIIDLPNVPERINISDGNELQIDKEQQEIVCRFNFTSCIILLLIDDSRSCPSF